MTIVRVWLLAGDSTGQLSDRPCEVSADRRGTDKPASRGDSAFLPLTSRSVFRIMLLPLQQVCFQTPVGIPPAGVTSCANRKK